MVKCWLCGREFKDKAGLSGHMRFSHPSARPVDGDKLEERLLALEFIARKQVKLTNGMVELLAGVSKVITRHDKDLELLADYLAKVTPTSTR